MKVRVILSRAEFDMLRARVAVAAEEMQCGKFISAYDEIVRARDMLGRIAWQLEPEKKKVGRR